MSRENNILNPKTGLSFNTIKKALENMNPTYKKFFSSAAAWGYPLESAIDYLRSGIVGSGQMNEQRDLESREPSLRSDERAALSKMKSSQLPFDIAKGAASTATKLGAVGLGAAALGGFGRNSEPEPQEEENMEAQVQGNQPQQQMPQQEQQSQEMQQQPQQPQAPQFDLETFQAQYPELYNFIVEKMQKGKGLSQAATIAKVRFGPQISEIEKMVNAPFPNFLEMAFGQRGPQMQGGMQSQGQGMSPSNQALLDAIQFVRQSRGG